MPDSSEMVLRIPGHLREMGKAFEKMMAEAEKAIAQTGGGKAVDYATVERKLADAAGAAEKSGNKAVLQALDVDVPAVVIGGVRYNRVGRCEAPYHTRTGTVAVERSLYRASGTRGGQPEGRVVDPVSLRAGVVGDGWLPGVARVMAHELQKGTAREAAAAAGEWGLLPYCRMSFERVAHLVGALTVADHRDIEDALIDAYDVPEEAVSVSASLDWVSVPMEEPRRRPVGRPRKGAPKNPVARNFRMAYCGTVTLHDQTGKALHTIRYGCMPKGDVVGMRDRMVTDVAILVAKKPDLRIQLLCDGAPEMWNALEQGFTEAKFGSNIHRLVDLHHLTEKLSAAAKVIEGQEGVGGSVVRWKHSLIQRAGAATEIRAELIASGKEDVVVGVGKDRERPVHAAITYLKSHAEDADRMNYARARRLGLALGSGNVEATCKSLFEMRLKRCGSRWKETTGQHIVQLRALALSDRWGHAVELTLRPLRQAVRVAA